MKKIKTAAVLFMMAAFCGCTAVSDRPPAEQSETQQSGEQTEEAQVYEEVKPQIFEISPREEHIKLNAEGGAFEGNVRTDGEYDGKGYIVLDEGMNLRHIAPITASQFYTVVIAAHSYDGAAIRLSAPNESVGTFYVSAEEEMTFSLYAVDSLFLSEGPNILSFDVLSGSASIDYILIDSSTAAAMSAYRIGSSTVGGNSTVATIGLMKFLSRSYGEKILTAQNVTPGTNAEIDAIYAETGRYPAIRTSDLLYSTLVSDTAAEKNAAEQEAAVEWGKSGGIVSYAWHWYSPSSDPQLYAENTSFRLAAAMTDRDIARSSVEEIEGLHSSEMISDSCYALIRDIDTVAAALKVFSDEGISVIFEPIPNGDSSLYWWGGDAESYKWLWRLMFTRLDSYHGLNNLIWVFSGSNAEFYPGDDYCDIIGQGNFENSTASFAGRFAALARISDTDTKPIAITACNTLPNPAYCVRDNAMWLWCAIGSGNNIITNTGALSESFNSWQQLHDFYNNTATITLDELPIFTEYAFEE